MTVDNRSFVNDRYIVQPIAAHCAERKNDPALECGARRLSYGELGYMWRERMAILASYIQPGSFVAVEHPKSIELVVDFLAVLALGGIYVPIDPSWPAARRQALSAQVPLTCRLGSAGPTSEPAPQRPALTAAEVSDLAYVFFTSGSTGTPKPVLGSAAGLSAFIGWQHAQFGIGPGDRIAFLTALGFDVSLRDMLMPLYAGATLVIPTDRDAASPDATVAWLERRKITALHAVPSVARNWLRYGRNQCTTVRTVFFAGEPLSVSLLEGWLDLFPQTRERVNLYGPTETTLAKFFNSIPRERRVVDPVPVGRPLPGTRYCLIGPGEAFTVETVRRCLKNPATEGEIVIVTPHASHGYLGMPKETAARFIDVDGLTAYRTGDLGRLDGAGDLIVVGRADDEVKINGVRIHPVEVANAIRAHDAVSDVAVVARKSSADATGAADYRLIAYVVLKDGRSPGDPDLRADLLETLPAYMVPAQFVELPALPKTPNGKVDRNALPDPATLDGGARPFVAPVGDVEHWLAAQWSDLLSVERVGATDSFFALGGNSIAATQLAARILNEYGVEVRLRTIFTHPTLRAIADVVVSEQLKAVDQNDLLAMLDALEPSMTRPSGRTPF